MSAIITPTLVRRYLLATGWTVEQIGARLAWTRPDGSSCWTALDAVPVMLNAAPPLRADEYGARLGMLAAAEMAESEHERLRLARDAYPQWIESGRDERAIHRQWDLFNAAANEALLFRAKCLEAAGLTPEAWEEAKGR